MGGIAAIAKSAGHDVTGCDANVYPPMSTQLAKLGIGLTEGWDPVQLAGAAKGADVFVVGNVVSRGNPLMEAILNAGCRTSPARNGCSRTCCTTSGCWRWPARTARRRRRRCSHGFSSMQDCAGIPDRRRAGRLPRLRAVDRQRVLRDRGRRIRHGVLRQALEVRPLPAAHGDPQQPRIRSRRHFSGSGGDRNAVPPSRAHDSRQRPHHRQRRRGQASRACWREAAGARSSASAWRRWRAPARTGRSPSTARSCWAAPRRGR